MNFLNKLKQEISELNHSLKKSNTEEDLLKKIAIMHNSRKEHLIRRNTAENQLNVTDPKRFTFEGSEDNISNGNSENKVNKYVSKELNKINPIQTVFLYEWILLVGIILWLEVNFQFIQCFTGSAPILILFLSGFRRIQY